MTEKELKELQQAYRLVFDSPDGRRVLADLHTRCNMNRSTYSEKPNEIYFLEGQRNVVLWILDILREDNRKLPTTTEME